MQTPFHKQQFQISKRVKDCFETGLLSSGQYVEELEREFARYVRAHYAVAVDSCTSGLYLALKAVKERFTHIDSVSIPSVTFASVAHVAAQAGYKIHLDDRMPAGEAYELVGTNIFDSAHNVSKDCHRGFMSVFSFYPTKVLPSAEGGMITTDDEVFAKELRLMRNNGRDRGGWDYSIERSGWKMNMTNLQAAIALDKLEELEERHDRVDEIRIKYNEAFKQEETSLHLYILEVKDRGSFIRQMNLAGIECSVHFKPLHLQPAFENLEVNNKTEIEEKSKHIVSIPFHENLTDEEVNHIIKTVKDTYEIIQA